MAFLPKTRIYDSKRYRLHNDYLRLDTAEWQAGKLRSKGWKVRIARLLGLYGVYKRKGN